MWKHEPFTSRVISIIWDEGHCVSKWADFRPEYKTAGRLRYLIPQHIPFYVTSATLPLIVLDDVKNTLHIRTDSAYIIERSNDRVNVSICVREMVHPAKSYLDLAFLIPENPEPGWQPPKFLIFFDDIAESIAVAKFLRKRLPPELQHMIKWFNSDMSAEFRDAESMKLKEGETWGLCCTESFGMVRVIGLRRRVYHSRLNQGMDLPDIQLIIQWRASCDLCTLWQRFGRAVRDLKLQGKALFLVESKYFDAAKKAKAAAAAELKWKAVEREAGKAPPKKRARTSKGACDTSKEVTKEQEMVIEGQSSEQDADDMGHIPSTTDAEAASSRPTGSSNDNSNPVSNESQLNDAAKQLFEAERHTEYEKIPRVDRKCGIRKLRRLSRH